MKLIAIDMDGTLLSEDGTISDTNIESLLAAEKKGHRIAICSGRSHHDILQILEHYRLKASIISGNGAVIYHNRLLKQLLLPHETVEELIEIIQNECLLCELYTDKGILIKKNDRQILEDDLAEQERLNPVTASIYKREMKNLFAQKQIHFVNHFHEADLFTLPIYKINAISYRKEKRDTLLTKLNKRHDISMTSGSLGAIEIGHAQTNKGFGLTFLANFFTIPLKHTVAIGDNFNDIPMFEAAGISIAMGNAHESVKACATYVTDGHHHNGVAKALKDYVLF
ncbi:HAD family phosphatase [Bacillus sp. WMMC1349]|uniref:Cof-type HAD-IIB family hydrolase n=1 Tax=Bacillus sp. WMMC1349 TaxID=2736254 RepID=UPI001551D189|nr:Cof-type HAD-IIB family hydrolase [Bacillus sp. WMMC1349]NPC94223.1 HAD family phosphatase [Bacillus sp. WMMC1349]